MRKNDRLFCHGKALVTITFDQQNNAFLVSDPSYLAEEAILDGNNYRRWVVP